MSELLNFRCSRSTRTLRHFCLQIGLLAVSIASSPAAHHFAVLVYTADPPKAKYKGFILMLDNDICKISTAPHKASFVFPKKQFPFNYSIASKRHTIEGIEQQIVSADWTERAGVASKERPIEIVDDFPFTADDFHDFSKDHR